MKKALLLLLLVFAPFYLYAQYSVKINLAQNGIGGKWGYQDLQGKWVIGPQFIEAYDFSDDGVAEVLVGFVNYTGLFSVWINPRMSYTKQLGLIDLNGHILVKYKADISQKQKAARLAKAIKSVAKRRSEGSYDGVYARFVQVDAAILTQRQKEQAKQAEQDRIIAAQRALKLRADSIAKAKRIAESLIKAKQRQADSIWLAKEHKVYAVTSSGSGLSLRKIKITGDGLLLRKDETHRTYSITRDDYNRLHIAYDGDMRARGVLDVKKVILESDWSLLSDNLFHKIEIAKATATISRGGRAQTFGVFSFLVTLNLNDLDAIHTDEEAALTVLSSISQVERYITSFKTHYQTYAYLVEPLFEVRLGKGEGITVGIVDKQDNGASIEDVKRICTEARQKLAAQRVREAK